MTTPPWSKGIELFCVFIRQLLLECTAFSKRNCLVQSLVIRWLELVLKGDAYLSRTGSKDAEVDGLVEVRRSMRRLDDGDLVKRAGPSRAVVVVSMTRDLVAAVNADKEICVSKLGLYFDR